MRSIHHYIVKNDYAYNTTFKTESGLELEGDKRFLSKRLANRLAVVVALPFENPSSELKVGYEVMVDPTLFLRANHTIGGEIENSYMIDSVNGLYKSTEDMIVLYRKDADSEWRGFGKNLIVDFTKKKEVNRFDIIPKITIEREHATILYSNTLLEEIGIKAGDEILADRAFGISTWINDKEYFWTRNDYTLCKVLENGIL